MKRKQLYTEALNKCKYFQSRTRFKHLEKQNEGALINELLNEKKIYLYKRNSTRGKFLEAT